MPLFASSAGAAATSHAAGVAEVVARVPRSSFQALTRGVSQLVAIRLPLRATGKCSLGASTTHAAAVIRGTCAVATASPYPTVASLDDLQMAAAAVDATHQRRDRLRGRLRPRERSRSPLGGTMRSPSERAREPCTVGA